MSFRTGQCLCVGFDFLLAPSNVAVSREFVWCRDHGYLGDHARDHCVALRATGPNPGCSMQTTQLLWPFVSVLLIFSASSSTDSSFTHTSMPTLLSTVPLIEGEQNFAPASVTSVFAHFRAVAETSAYVQWIDRGTSHKGHPLGYAVVGTPARLVELSRIRTQLHRLGDPRNVRSEGEHQNLLKTLPAVVWLTCSVHGHELAPADAACCLVALLANATHPLVQTIHDSLLVLIDPLRNPDGRDRALMQRDQWRSRQAVSDGQSFHHLLLWPGARGNHYFIDPNRDAWQLSQPETQSRALDVVEWQPQIVVDLHEMRSYDTYLFSPPGVPFPTFIPDTVHDWWGRFAKSIGRAMTAHGSDYYHGDWHEAFAPDRFVAWSLRIGATGLLLEVPGVDGTAVIQPDGACLTFAETVNRHLVAVAAILETAAKNRSRLLKDFHQFRRNVVSGDRPAKATNRIALRGRIEDRVSWLPPERENAQGETLTGRAVANNDASPARDAVTLWNGRYRSVLIPPSRNESRRRAMAQILVRQGIEIGITEAAIKRSNAQRAEGTTRGNEPFPPGTVVIDLHQPLGALAASLLDPVPAMEESTLLMERRSLVYTEKSMISQYTAWSLPFWADVDVWYGGGAVDTEPLPAEWFDMVSTKGSESGRTASLLEQWARSHAFLLNAADDAALSATLRLLESGVSLRASAVGIGTRGISFAPGTIIVPARERNDVQKVIECCLSAKAEPVPVDLALMDYGTDLGGREVVPVKMPRVAILTGFGTSALAMGRLWFLFDKEMEWPVSLLPIQNVDSADLTAYTVLILPDAAVERGRRLREIIGRASWERLLNWVSFGGTLILCGESIAAIPQQEDELPGHFAIRRELLELIPRLERDRALDLYSAGLLADSATRYWKPQWLDAAITMPEEAALWDARTRHYAPRGVFLRLRRNADHWLLAGLSKSPCIPVDTKQAYHALGAADAIACFESGTNLCAAGLLWPEAARRWEASDALMRERIGSGQLIGIAGDFKHGSPVLDRLVLNAAILGPTFVDH